MNSHKTPKNTINQFLELTNTNHWVKLNDDYLYLVGLAYGRYDDYWVALDSLKNVHLISCALDFDNDIIEKPKDTWRNDNESWKEVRKAIYDYFITNKNDHLIYFDDKVCEDEIS